MLASFPNFELSVQALIKTAENQLEAELTEATDANLHNFFLLLLVGNAIQTEGLDGNLKASSTEALATVRVVSHPSNTSISTAPLFHVPLRTSANPPQATGLFLYKVIWPVRSRGDAEECGGLGWDEVAVGKDCLVPIELVIG